MRPARAVRRVQVRQLRPQEGGLQPVETLVEADLDVLALAPLAEVAQAAGAARDLGIIRAHGAGVAERRRGSSWGRS